MNNLTDLGFSKGIIVETIVTTYNMDGQPNAAPMGATMTNPQRITLRIFNSSLTYKNLQSKRCAVINVTTDPEIFYKTALKEATVEGTVPQKLFEKAETVNAPKLRTADAHIEVTVADIIPLDAERVEVTFQVELVQALSVLPKVYCRALFATIEAIIHATRVEAFIVHGEREKQEQALKLMERIRECNDVVNRVAPNSRYSEIMADLNQRVNSWRAKGESLR